MDALDIDASPYPNITELYRTGFRRVDAHLGRRRFRIWIFEKLRDRDPPIYSANYEEATQVQIRGEWQSLWVKTDLPWEAADSVEDCLRAALAQVNKA